MAAPPAPVTVDTPAGPAPDASVADDATTTAAASPLASRAAGDSVVVGAAQTPALADASALASLATAFHVADTGTAAAPAPVATATPAATPAPSGQVANAIVHLANTGGDHQVTISLAPRELGHVQIQLRQHATGGASVAVTVERPATLELLHHDKTQLQAALDRAGVTVASGGVTLHLRTDSGHNLAAAPTAAMASTQDRGPTAAPGAGGQTLLGGDRSNGQSPGQGEDQRPGAPITRVEDPASPVVPVTAAADGLDITA